MSDEETTAARRMQCAWRCKTARLERRVRELFDFDDVDDGQFAEDDTQLEGGSSKVDMNIHKFQVRTKRVSMPCPNRE